MDKVYWSTGLRDFVQTTPVHQSVLLKGDRHESREANKVVTSSWCAVLLLLTDRRGLDLPRLTGGAAVVLHLGTVAFCPSLHSDIFRTPVVVVENDVCPVLAVCLHTGTPSAAVLKSRSDNVAQFHVIAYSLVIKSLASLLALTV